MNDLIVIKKELQVIKELLANNSKKVLNLNELADYIGFSKSYVYKLTSQNLIPHSKPNGKAVFFDRDEIDKWLLNNSTITHQQSRRKALMNDKETWTFEYGEWGYVVKDEDWPNLNIEWTTPNWLILNSK